MVELHKAGGYGWCSEALGTLAAGAGGESPCVVSLSSKERSEAIGIDRRVIGGDEVAIDPVEDDIFGP